MCHILASRASKAARTGIRKFHEQSMVYDDGAPKKKAGKGRGATPAGPSTPPCEAGLAGLRCSAGIEGTKCPRAKIMLRVLRNLEFPSAKFGLAQEWIGWPQVDASCGSSPLFGEWGATVSGSLGHDRRIHCEPAKRLKRVSSVCLDLTGF